MPGLDALPDYDARKWKQFSIDVLRGKIKAREPFPKLPYFSGRLGFREAEYTVSAALQAVVAGAGPEWSLLILTHEMVHGHVRNLLAMIFQDIANRPPDEKWNDFYKRFEARCKGNPPTRESFLDSLRAVLLTYCCNALTHGSLTQEAVSPEKHGKDQDVSLPFNLPTPEELWVAYETEHRNISEVFVHVLDLHYFYRGCLTQYVRLIWRSWSTIPQVCADLRQYMLRSLLVIATKTEGTPYERFTLARSRFAELLETLQTKEAPVVGQVLKRINGAYAEKHLFYPFSTSLILVDLVHHVLTSGTILGALNAGDPHFKVAKMASSYEEWLLYDLAEEFVDDVVISPTAYLADRLSRVIDHDSENFLESKTAALFLACASNVNKGAPNV